MIVQKRNKMNTQIQHENNKTGPKKTENSNKIFSKHLNAPVPF